MKISFINIIWIVIALSFTFSSHAREHKKQDADYVAQWCSGPGKTKQLPLPNGLRPDCTTDKNVVEIDYAKGWKKNIEQVLGYGRSSNKKPLLVLVVEQTSDRKFVDLAVKDVERRKLKLEIQSLENLASSHQSFNEIDGPIVKRSNKDKCHVKNVGAYGNIKKYKSYYSLDACLSAGGKLPGGVLEATLRKGERKAIDAAKKPKPKLNKPA